jgi:signal transduction histidine kinase
LRIAKSEARLLTAQLTTAQEIERKRVAMELHDEIGQSLSAAKFSVEGALRQLEASCANGLAIGVLAAVLPRLQLAVEEVHRIAMDLRPSMLDDLGICATLAWFFRQYESVYPNIRIAKHIDVRENKVPAGLKTTIYRITQEAMNNIAKHARANSVTYELRETGAGIELSIDDNGVGFDPALIGTGIDARPGLGLACMRERVESCGGVFKLVTRGGKGTVLMATWPCATRRKHGVVRRVCEINCGSAS